MCQDLSGDIQKGYDPTVGAIHLGVLFFEKQQDDARLPILDPSDFQTRLNKTLSPVCCDAPPAWITSGGCCIYRQPSNSSASPHHFYLHNVGWVSWNARVGNGRNRCFIDKLGSWGRWYVGSVINASSIWLANRPVAQHRAV